MPTHSKHIEHRQHRCVCISAGGILPLQEIQSQCSGAVWTDSPPGTPNCTIMSSVPITHPDDGSNTSVCKCVYRVKCTATPQTDSSCTCPIFSWTLHRRQCASIRKAN